MYNAKPPADVELPSAGKLIRSTAISIVVAGGILVTTVLPAEYAIDPTGIGRLLGLTSMGEIKKSLEKESKEHSQFTPRSGDRRSVFTALGNLLISPAAAEEKKPAAKATDWKDEVTFTLKPGQGFEIKLTMKKGVKARYEWTATGGRINYDLHAHAGGSNARYKRGRGKQNDSGSFTARFDGDHGWFFRNRDRNEVKVVMKFKGDYSGIVRQ